MKSTPALSKPVQAGLALAITLTAIALLKPDEIAWLDQIRENTGLGSESSGTGLPDTMQTVQAVQQKPPWVRPPAQEWQAAQEASPTPAEPVQAVPEPVPEPPPPPVVAQAQPVAPEPTFTYLGRFEQDGRHYVLLSNGNDPHVVEIGSLVDAHWRVENLTATEVQLRYLPLKALRSIAILPLASSPAVPQLMPQTVSVQ